MFKNQTISLAGFVMLALFASQSYAGHPSTYQVTITNITQTQTFTPFILATHQRSITLFELGSPASMDLEILAESGNVAPLAATLNGAGHKVKDVVTGDSLLGPGESITFEIAGNRFWDSLSVAAMLIPTNDTFAALNAVSLPRWGSATYFATAYDAGTEANDQSCQNIPGPRCGGAGNSPVPGPGDEGFVHVSNGFHDLGDTDDDGFEVLDPATYDWRNPVARITVKRVRK